MYWPLGAPQTYTARTHASRPRAELRTSDDGLEDATKEEESQNGIDTQDQGGGRGKRARSEDTIRPGDLNGSRQDDQHEISQEEQDRSDEAILDLSISRSGSIIASITASALHVWQTKPMVVTAAIVRSALSLERHGQCKCVHLKSDASVVIIQTSLDYLLVYSIVADPLAQIYRTYYTESGSSYARRKSISSRSEDSQSGPGEGHGVREVSIAHKSSIKIEAGISKALALDNEILVATCKPAAVQTIQWTAGHSGRQHDTYDLNDLEWLANDVHVTEMVYDRPMNLSAWVTSDGRAYAVQRKKPGKASGESTGPRSFKGYCFHKPDTAGEQAVKATINARFSLITVGCANGQIHVYNAKDYTGNIVLSHKLSEPPSAGGASGALAVVSYSPDGYALFAGYDHGWSMWSVYGKPGANSFHADREISVANSDQWLLGVKHSLWLGGGCQILLHSAEDADIWILDMGRSAITGCFSAANVTRTLLQTNSGVMIYRGHEAIDSTAGLGEIGFWTQIPIPSQYLAHQWPIRSSVVSSDCRYVAVAGRRGLAHYSVTSGRWKTFDDTDAENEFTVRGGMSWYQHVLIVAVETSYETHELRVYSRETALDSGTATHVEQLESPVVILTSTGTDSLLVYTYNNTLLHYVINVTNRAVKLVQVGQINLSGIIRAPPRVRALSWILPEDQLDNGDPTQDVVLATIIFLVDGKLVALQPATKDTGELKYEMRIIAQNVEYYALMREHQNAEPKSQSQTNGTIKSSSDAPDVPLYHQTDLKDSLWFFDGKDMCVWTDVHDILASASPELARELTEPVRIPVDFYPLAPVLDKGVLFGVETEMIQRRDTSFTYLRHVTRTHLFLPPVLRYHISQYNTPSALYLAHAYTQLPYFPHALEVLLHDVLDEEVDSPPALADQAVLPPVLAFLASFPSFLDVILQCTRKTEVRSWRTLFSHLPSPQQLFAQSLERGDLKTAGGYLLVLHTLEDEAGNRSSSRQVVELLKRAKDEGEWELCKELARFLRALDEDGTTLARALEDVGLAALAAGDGVRRNGRGASRLSVSGPGPIGPNTNGVFE